MYMYIHIVVISGVFAGWLHGMREVSAGDSMRLSCVLRGICGHSAQRRYWEFKAATLV